MATATLNQEASFIKRWEPAAQQASQKLGIPASYVLAQWAAETGWGTQNPMGKNNPGNILQPNGQPINFSTVTDFINEYIPSVLSDFPYLQIAMSENNGIIVPSSPQTIFGGNQTYAKPPVGKNASWYGPYVQSVYDTLENITKGHQNKLNSNQWNSELNLGKNISKAAKNVENAVSNPIISAIHYVATPLEKAVWGFVGIIGIILGIWLVAKGAS